jgi:fatty acid-binding protein DegV
MMASQLSAANASAQRIYEVIDSQVITMGLGQLAIFANTIAESGKGLQQV